MFCSNYIQVIVAHFAWRCCFVAPLVWHHCHLCSSCLKLLFPSSCLTCCCAPFLQCHCYFMLFFFDIVALFLLFKVVVLLLLLDLLLYSSCLMLLFILLNIVVPCLFKYLSTTLVILLFLVPFVQHCSYCPSFSNWYSTPYFFCRCGGAIQIRVF